MSICTKDIFLKAFTTPRFQLILILILAPIILSAQGKQANKSLFEQAIQLMGGMEESVFREFLSGGQIIQICYTNFTKFPGMLLLSGD